VSATTYHRHCNCVTVLYVPGPLHSSECKTETSDAARVTQNPSFQVQSIPESQSLPNHLPCKSQLWGFTVAASCHRNQSCTMLGTQQKKHCTLLPLARAQLGRPSLGQNSSGAPLATTTEPLSSVPTPPSPSPRALHHTSWGWVSPTRPRPRPWPP